MTTNTTPKYAFPWPAGDERVMDGDNAIGALAQAVEAVLWPSLAGLVPVYLRANGQLVLGTADVLVPHPTWWQVTPTAQEVALVVASFDLNITTAGAGVCTGSIFSDGVTRGGGGTYGPAATGRASVIHVATVALPPGPHTIDLRARKSLAGGVAACEYVGAAPGNVSATYLAAIRFRVQPTMLLERVGDALAEAFGEELRPA
jgi:hypothetical protein